VIQACIHGITEEWWTAIVVFWLGCCSLPKYSPVCHQGMVQFLIPVNGLSMYLRRPSKLVSEGLASVGGNVEVGILNKGMSHYWSVLCMKVVATMPHAPLCSSLPKIPFLDFKLCLTRQNISLGSC
jgi:hypothetical protein